MSSATKIAFNTVILYSKILGSMAISLISVPIVLNALGASDYGVYNLIAGVVAMLAFLNNSLTVSSQRYMSVSLGGGDNKKINLVYNTSFYLHLLLGIAVIVAFEIGSFFIHFLNITPDRLSSAYVIYQFLIVSTFSRIISVPFDALINAHEDMFIYAIIEMCNSILLLVCVFSLKYIPYDKLVYYGFCVGSISVITLIAKYLWCRLRYKEYKLRIWSEGESSLGKEMFGFAGWNLFGAVALMGRNQVVAIIINLFLGTVMNAAYGIANHINGALSNFSSTFQKAINPQLMKSEGMKNRERLLRISYMSSKYSVLALSFFAIPFIVEMRDILPLWLGKEIPPYTIELSCCILVLTITYQYSVGIMSAIQAVGQIRNYQIMMGGIILLNIPCAYLILKMGFPVYYVTICYIILEIISLCVRIIMAGKLVGMPIEEYLKKVVVNTQVIIIPSIIMCMIPHSLITSLYLRIILTILVFAVFYMTLFWRFALEPNQKNDILLKVKKYVSK